ncbi:MAG TPA: IS1 family transposase [Candidatus Competibacter sp.]|nr:IS1 family transposase [Candidatus Competibacter sp.]
MRSKAIVTIALRCLFWGSDSLIKYGITPNGKQHYRRQSFGCQHREPPGSNAYSGAARAMILRAYEERSSLRGLSRTFGVSRNTVSGWLKKALTLPPLQATLVPAHPREALEVDELWSFVGHLRWGVIWLWLALCRRTQQIVAYTLAPRRDATARLLWSRLPTAYCQGPLQTDHLESDHNVLPPAQHQASDYRGPTDHVERFNNTLRQRLGRLVRKTLSFSKGPQMHESTLCLFLHHYSI